MEIAAAKPDFKGWTASFLNKVISAGSILGKEGSIVLCRIDQRAQFICRHKLYLWPAVSNF